MVSVQKLLDFVVWRNEESIFLVYAKYFLKKIKTGQFCLSIQILNSLRRKKWDYRIVSHLYVFRMLFLEIVLLSTRSRSLALNIQQMKLLESMRSGGMLMHTCMHTYVSLCVCVGICMFAYLRMCEVRGKTQQWQCGISS